LSQGNRLATSGYPTRAGSRPLNSPWGPNGKWAACRLLRWPTLRQHRRPAWQPASVAALQRRHQVVSHPTEEDFAIDGSIHDQGRRQARGAKRREEGRGIPVTVRHAGPQTLAPRGPLTRRRFQPPSTIVTPSAVVNRLAV